MLPKSAAFGRKDMKGMGNKEGSKGSEEEEGEGRSREKQMGKAFSNSLLSNFIRSKFTLLIIIIVIYVCIYFTTPGKSTTALQVSSQA